MFSRRSASRSWTSLLSTPCFRPSFHSRLPTRPRPDDTWPRAPSAPDPRTRGSRTSTLRVRSLLLSLSSEVFLLDDSSIPLLTLSSLRGRRSLRSWRGSRGLCYPPDVDGYSSSCASSGSTGRVDGIPSYRLSPSGRSGYNKRGGGVLELPFSFNKTIGY